MNIFEREENPNLCTLLVLITCLEKLNLQRLDYNGKKMVWLPNQREFVDLKNVSYIGRNLEQVPIFETNSKPFVDFE
jgi:hypothetical protein